MIFYFTGTGNSLYAAKKLAEKLGDSEVYSMAEYKPDSQIGGKDKYVGFVFPTYYGNLPRIMRNFINRVIIHPDTYIFGIITKGGSGSGSITALEKVLAEKNLKLKYGCGIPMPANYIINYNPMFFRRAVKSIKKIQKIADDIKSEKVLIKRGHITANKLYRNIESLDEKFYADNECTGCGQCEGICPVQNIKLVDNKPVWQHHCEHCVACIHWCPQKAIQYGDKTKKRRRYHHPEIKVSELMRQ